MVKIRTFLTVKYLDRNLSFCLRCLTFTPQVPHCGCLFFSLFLLPPHHPPPSQPHLQPVSSFAKVVCVTGSGDLPSPSLFSFRLFFRCLTTSVETVASFASDYSRRTKGYGNPGKSTPETPWSLMISSVTTDYFHS